MADQINLDEILSEKLGITLSVRSLAKVAEAYSVSVYRVKKWREVCYSLSPSAAPFNLGDIAFELAHKKLVSLSEMPNEIQRAMALSVASEAAGAGSIQRIVDDLMASNDRPPSNLLQRIRSPELKATLTKARAERAALRPTDRVAIAIASPKTAALFVDRVWTLDVSIPSEIEFDGGSLEESMVRGLVESVAAHAFKSKHGRELFETNSTNEDDVEAFLEGLDEKMPQIETILAPKLEHLVQTMLTDRHARSIVPFMSTQDGFDQLHKPGELLAIACTVKDLRIVDERALKWDQVQEIRKDADANSKLRRFVHWVDDKLSGKPIQFIEDELQLRLEEYETALEKHGVRCVQGALSTLIDRNTWQGAFASLLAALAAGTMDLGTAIQQAASAGVAFAYLGGRFTLEYMKINREGKHSMDTNEIAFLHSVKTLGHSS